MSDKDSTVTKLDRAALIVTKVQAQALADLLWEGKLAGTTLPDVEPPERVALVGLGTPGSVGEELAQNRDGSHAVGADGSVPWVPSPVAHTLGVVADDGRSWQIVRAGICWPVEKTSEG